MKEAQYILRSITPTSLIILDELCKGTAIEEGASIAWAICEKLLNTTAFIFAATHFFNLTKLGDLYFNVTKYLYSSIYYLKIFLQFSQLNTFFLNYFFFSQYFETINVQGSKSDNCHYRLTYTHRLKSGVAPTDDYGIVLAELSGLPKTVTEKARKYASEQIVSIYNMYIYIFYLSFINFNSYYAINTLLFIFYNILLLILTLLCKFVYF